jgi:hypothetical protein
MRSNNTKNRALCLKAAAFTTLLAAPFSAALAQVTLPPVSIGAGVRASFTDTSFDGDTTPDVSDFDLNSARIYISGSVTENIKVMFNTEYQPGNEDIEVIDAAAMFSFGDKFNVWAGRFLPPSDRANMYGPYYANHWGSFTDGVQDGYPFETTGRDDGLMYWGQFGITKVSFGAFDVPSTKGDSDVLWAGRVQMDFWDQEAGYYLNGTYYGEKDLLAVGVAAQNAFGNNAYSVDFLMEKKIGSGGVVTVEAEYAKYDELGGYLSAFPKSDGYYVLGAYLFPQVVGMGKFQVLAKYGEVDFEDAFVLPLVNVDHSAETLELNVNYLIKTFNARVTLFYIDQDSDIAANVGAKQMGVGLQVQL